MPRAIQSMEEAPFAIGIKNISTKDFGINSAQQRILNVTLLYEVGQSEVEYIPRQEGMGKLLPGDDGELLNQ